MEVEAIAADSAIAGEGYIRNSNPDPPPWVSVLITEKFFIPAVATLPIVGWIIAIDPGGAAEDAHRQFRIK